jgi:hypothetical protein
MMAWAAVWDRADRAVREKVVPIVLCKEARARAWVMAGATAIAPFREAMAKEDRDTGEAGIMIAAATALFREAAVKDTGAVKVAGVVRLMVEAQTTLATAPVRITVAATPVVRNITVVDRDTDAVDRIMARVGRAIAAVATSNTGKGQTRRTDTVTAL